MGMELATFRSASVNYATSYPHSCCITSPILRYLSFCHQGQIQNVQILEVTGDLYNARSSTQMGQCSTHLGLGTRCIWVISFATRLIYPTKNLPHRARLNDFLKKNFSSCREYRRDSSLLKSVEKFEQHISCLGSFFNVRAGGIVTTVLRRVERPYIYQAIVTYVNQMKPAHVEHFKAQCVVQVSLA